MIDGLFILPLLLAPPPGELPPQNVAAHEGGPHGTPQDGKNNAPKGGPSLGLAVYDGYVCVCVCVTVCLLKRKRERKSTSQHVTKQNRP